jgi:hypothetical protein
MSNPTHPAIVALREALDALKIDTSGLTFRYIPETVQYPGGSYENNQIEVSNGTRRRLYSADLALKTPMVGAYEIRRDLL